LEHRQSEILTLVSFAVTALSGHFEQSLVPMGVLYVFTAHFVQVSVGLVIAPEKPGLHRQAATVAEPVPCVAVFVGHDLHVGASYVSW